MFKTRLLGTVAALALSATVASAADLYRAPPPAVPVAPVLIPGYVWTGGFVGVQVGYGWGDADFRGTGRDPKADGFVVGVHGGFNWQMNALVIGADTSWSWTDMNGSRRCAVLTRCSADINWAGDIRGRVGFAFDRFHLYGAAGLALADVDVRVRSAFPGVGFRKSDTEAGWTAGLGAEYAITNNFIMGVEWKYTDYGRVTRGVDLSTNVVQLRASYKF